MSTREECRVCGLIDKNEALELEVRKLRKEVKLLCKEVRKVKRKITSMNRADGDRETEGGG